MLVRLVVSAPQQRVVDRVPDRFAWLLFRRRLEKVGYRFGCMNVSDQKSNSGRSHELVVVACTFRLVGGGETLPSSVASLLSDGGGMCHTLLALWKTSRGDLVAHGRIVLC